MTIEQCHHHNRNQVLRSAPRWKEFAAVERKHGLDQCPYEARAYAFYLANGLRHSLEDGLFVERGWSDRRQYPPYDAERAVRVMAAYIPSAQLVPLVADIRDLAQRTALAAEMPIGVRYRQTH